MDYRSKAGNRNVTPGASYCGERYLEYEESGCRASHRAISLTRRAIPAERKDACLSIVREGSCGPAISIVFKRALANQRLCRICSMA